MTRCAVTDHSGHAWVGELLYLYRYPRRIVGKSGFVERVDHVPQRVGLRIEARTDTSRCRLKW